MGTGWLVKLRNSIEVHCSAPNCIEASPSNDILLRFLIAVTALCLASCVSQAERERLSQANTASVPVCDTPRECTQKWNASRAWIERNAGYKLRIDGPNFLATDPPTDTGAVLAAQVSKDEVPGGAFRINALIWCTNRLACVPDSSVATQNFNAYVNSAAPNVFAADFAMPAVSQRISVSIGSLPLSIPEPDGFVDMRSNSEVMGWASALVEPSTELLTVLVPKNDPGAATLSYSRYVILKTPTRYLERPVSQSEFASIRVATKQIMENPGRLADFATHATPSQLTEPVPADGGSSHDFVIDSVALLDVLFDTETRYASMLGEQSHLIVSGQRKNFTIANCGGALLVQDKLVYFGVYSALGQDRDRKWIKTTCTALILGARVQVGA